MTTNVSVHPRERDGLPTAGVVRTSSLPEPYVALTLLDGAVVYPPDATWLRSLADTCITAAIELEAALGVSATVTAGDVDVNPRAAVAS